MDPCNSQLHSVLYSMFIEEAVRGGQANYRPSHMAFNPWMQHINDISHHPKPRPYWLLSVKLAGRPVVRIKLPKWVSVRVVV